jgi:hypothetical protein
VEVVEREGGRGAAAAEHGVEEARGGGVQARRGQRGGELLWVGAVAAEQAVGELRGGGEGVVAGGAGGEAAPERGGEELHPHHFGGSSSFPGAD